ncbi:MAG: TetR/AcrR family transcriptional regulator [Sandaracinaceae bacterium]|nr:TetR/AcrR family transcriptional regulator [Sandaracinaceae bacterium]
MLDAAVDLLRSEGLPSLTTVRVTREAGIVQSGFYAHFKNPEHLQEELAERTGLALREHMATWMAALRATPSDDFAALTASYEDVLTLFRDEKELVDLFLRYRRTPSALGRVLGHLHTQLRADFFQYLRQHAGDPDAIRPHLGTIGVHADTLVAALLGVGEGIVDGRVGDLETAARELAALTHVPLRHLLAQRG